MAEARFEPYTSLKPYQALFETGTAILMYHKLGPRPRGVRLKGLYVSQRLFQRQLQELRLAGFSAATLAAFRGPCQGTQPKQIVLTFDDGFRSVLDFGLSALREAGFRAIQFLVSGRIGGRNEWDLDAGEVAAPLMDEPQVREWLAAGHEIGSHTRSHPWLTRLSAREAREEVSAGKKELEDRFGVPIRHFCYPYGDWNRAVRDLVAEAGYETACTTEAGMNPPGTDPLALKRFTARYASRNLKSAWQRVRRALAR